MTIITSIPSQTRSDILKYATWILALAVGMTLLSYAPGLNGPFLFDDSIHITQNRWVKIDSLGWADLNRAWNSSFSAFPANRPLAQLSFGINHAFAGLDPWAFKATNLAIHLLTGLLVFAFVRLAYRAVSGTASNDVQGRLLAAAVAAVWLLHPLHVSTVLYTVQRMAQLSSLAMLGALVCYLYGRIRIAEGRSGFAWMLAAAPIGAIGFLGKENAVLLPLLLLITEMTLLNAVSTGNIRRKVQFVWVLYIGLPLLAGLAYLLTQPGLMVYEGRPFTFEERVLTQPRVLWLYLKWLFVPDISQMGLFHDDLQLSTGLFRPPATLLAIVGLIILLAGAVLLRRRAPFFSFAVLFFLGNHALESTVLPLEMVFEHRNYLAAVGPLLFFAYLVTIASARMKVRPVAIGLGGLLLVSYTAATVMRIEQWSSYKEFMLTSAENHPDSPRSNFMAGQMLIAGLGEAGDQAPALAKAARIFLHNGLLADERCINCLFGLIILDLHLGQQTDSAVVQRLEETLRKGYVGPTKVSVTQFSFLVKWHQSGAYGLPPEKLEGIFDAALANPAWNHTGRAGIEAAYREYFEFVARDLDAALVHARAAVAAWPQQWGYHMSLVQVLRKLGHLDEALAALDEATKVASNDVQQQQTAEARASLLAGNNPLSEAISK